MPSRALPATRVAPTTPTSPTRPRGASWWGRRSRPASRLVTEATPSAHSSSGVTAPFWSAPETEPATTALIQATCMTSALAQAALGVRGHRGVPKPATGEPGRKDLAHRSGDGPGPVLEPILDRQPQRHGLEGVGPRPQEPLPVHDRRCERPRGRIGRAARTSVHRGCGLGRVGGDQRLRGRRELRVAVLEEGLVEQTSIPSRTPADEWLQRSPSGPITYAPYVYNHWNPSLSRPAGLIARAIVGGAVYGGEKYPSFYRGALFYGDYTQGWTAVARLDATGRPEQQRTFSRSMGPIVAYVYDDVSGYLYLVNVYTGRIQRLRHTSEAANAAPVAQAAATPATGGSGLRVQFSPSGSFDPDGDTVSLLVDLRRRHALRRPRPRSRLQHARRLQRRPRGQRRRPSVSRRGLCHRPRGRLSLDSDHVAHGLDARKVGAGGSSDGLDQ